MRLLASLTLATLLLAGCLQSGSAPAPGSGSTTPPATSTTPVSSTPPVVTGGAAVKPAHGSNTSADFTLEGDETASLILPGQDVTFSFVGTNSGGNATALFAPCDGGNPRIEVQDANGTTLDLIGPHMRCMVAMEWQPIGAGEQRSNNVTWNGTAWDGEKLAPVKPGTYYAVGTFLAQRDGQEIDLVVRLPIGVTDNRGAL